MRIHLIRHGETDWNATRRVQGQMESQLTELGKQQAADLAGQFPVASIDMIYCSSSIRTRETAEILFRDTHLPVKYQDNLREIHLGPWEGNLYDHLAQQDPEQYHFFWNEPHRFSLQGAESFRQLQQRGVDAVSEIVAQSSDSEIAVVSHGALIKSVLCFFEGRPLARLWDPPRMHNCAHSIVDFDSNGRGRIIQYAGVEYQPARNRLATTSEVSDAS